MKSTAVFLSGLACAAFATCAPVWAADTTAPGISRTEAKDLKNQSKAQMKAEEKTAEAAEVMNKADCKSALDGAAKRACEKSAKQHAKAEKADAKTVHEVQEQQIDRAKK